MPKRSYPDHDDPPPGGAGEPLPFVNRRPDAAHAHRLLAELITCPAEQVAVYTATLMRAVVNLRGGPGR